MKRPTLTSHSPRIQNPASHGPVAVADRHAEELAPGPRPPTEPSLFSPGLLFGDRHLAGSAVVAEAAIDRDKLFIGLWGVMNVLANPIDALGRCGLSWLRGDRIVGEAIQDEVP